jgi:hypothetical protein
MRVLVLPINSPPERFRKKQIRPTEKKHPFGDKTVR